MFIGHAENITGVAFTPDQLSVISCGEAIFIWDFLAHNTPRHTEMKLVKCYLTESYMSTVTSQIFHIEYVRLHL